MPPLAGFSHNPLRTREDLRTATLALLQSLCKYQSPGGARIRIPVATGAHFDETAAQLEGYARPLWAVAALLASESLEVLRSIAEPFVLGLENGTDPDHAEYWGPAVSRDQRMVEMEIVSYALLAAPDVFFHNRTPRAKMRITEWLKTITGKDMPSSNWLWFRVFTHLALIKVCGVPEEQLRSAIDQDLDALDTFSLENGWSSDGLWSEDGRQADYYSGSFAIQFSQLLYTKFAREIDPKRCTAYRERACQFSGDLCHYFEKSGAAIPFGRSLTYRFAAAGFWAAAAFAEVKLPSPFDDPGVVKGLLLRHIRWWTKKEDIFNVDGTLNIGFLYPNMFMCENYNSPQSVYWCMKSLCVLALPSEHAFWTSPEQEYPSTSIMLAKSIKPPLHIVCNTGSHHFLLSSGQFCPWPLKATEAKYGKFAYSSHFGFSVPTGPLLEQMAPDSTLALSADEQDTWKVRWIPTGARLGQATLMMGGKAELVPTLLSIWKPWRFLDVTVATTLIAPSRRWPDWHVRVHKISIGPDTNIRLSAVEGGFAIHGRRALDGLPIRQVTAQGLVGLGISGRPFEATLTEPGGCLVCSSDGVSGIRRLDLGDLSLSTYDSAGSILIPDANTNLMRQRTLIPALRSTISSNATGSINSYHMASAVFAMAEQRGTVAERWNDPPVIRAGRHTHARGAYISFDEW